MIVYIHNNARGRHLLYMYQKNLDVEIKIPDGSFEEATGWMIIEL